MSVVSVNLLAVLVCGIAAMVVGFIWYSLPVFGTAWMKEVGMSKDDVGKGPGLGYLGAFISALLTAYVLAHFVHYAGAETAAAGAATGFWAWLGFVATTIGMQYIFERRTVKLYAINVGMSLVTLVIMGMILAVWR